MFEKIFTAGAILAICLASTASADTPVRPVSPADLRAAQAAAAQEALSQSRAAARPAHMLRYPVTIETRAPDVRPRARPGYLPKTQWDFQDGAEVWTRAAMVAIATHGAGLDVIVPRDIDQWCPAYRQNPATDRQAFWVGMMSALAKFESTYNPQAVGGTDQWYGLLQIYPDTARRYGCRAQTGEALKDPVENLSCAARIMNVTVLRDNAVAVHDGRWRGIAADWAPMTQESKIAEMSAWTSRQDYCQP